MGYEKGSSGLLTVIWEGLEKTSRRFGTDFVFATKTMHVFLFYSYMPHALPIFSPYLVALTSLGKRL